MSGSTLWEKIPPSVNDWDSRLREQVVSVLEHGSPSWRLIKFITESVVASAGFLAILALVWIWLGRRAGQGWLALVRVVAAFALSLGLSDFVAYRVFKHSFCRLKPYVAGPYVEGANQALSFPSNHAFNLAFAWTLAWVVSPVRTRVRYRGLFALAALVSCAVGVSRVLVGEHYPLDVLGGWLTGALFAACLAPLFRRVAGLSRTTRHG